LTIYSEDWRLLHIIPAQQNFFQGMKIAHAQSGRLKAKLREISGRSIKNINQSKTSNQSKEYVRHYHT
jgi:hypothetical protein